MKTLLLTILIGISTMINAQSLDESRIVKVFSQFDPSVSIKIVFNAGAQYDPVGKAGLSNLTAQMISDGATKVNTYNQILEKLFPLAAGFSMNTSREVSVFSGRVHRDNFKLYYELFIQQVLSPAFNEDDFSRIKQNTLNYLTTNLKYSSDEELGKATLYNSIYEGTPYANPIQGTEAGLNSITLEDVKSFYTKYYNRSNFVMGIGGGFEKEIVVTLWNDLANLPVGNIAVAPKINPKEITGKELVVVDKGAASTAISIGFPINIVRGQRDWYALAVANSWLGEHRNSSSHLYQVIREIRGLNYGDYSYIEHYPNGGSLNKPPVNVPRRQHIFEIWIRPVPNENAHFALRAGLRELKSFVDKGLTQEQFATTRDFLKKYILHYAPTTNMRLGYALDDYFYGLKESHLSAYRNALETLTLAEVNSAIKKYLQYDKLKISVVTGNGEALLNEICIEKESPIKYSSAKTNDVLEEDKLISSFPLGIKKTNAKILTLDKLF